MRLSARCPWVEARFRYTADEMRQALASLRHRRFLQQEAGALWCPGHLPATVMLRLEHVGVSSRGPARRFEGGKMLASSSLELPAISGCSRLVPGRSPAPAGQDPMGCVATARAVRPSGR